MSNRPRLEEQEIKKKADEAGSKKVVLPWLGMRASYGGSDTGHEKTRLAMSHRVIVHGVVTISTKPL